MDYSKFHIIPPAVQEAAKKAARIRGDNYREDLKLINRLLAGDTFPNHRITVIERNGNWSNGLAFAIGPKPRTEIWQASRFRDSGRELFWQVADHTHGRMVNHRGAPDISLESTIASVIIHKGGNPS